MEGQPFSGANRYVLRFEKGKLPPVSNFWSVAAYDADTLQMLENPLHRYQIGTYDNIKAEADGSVTIYMQHDSPGKDKETNWLPAPAGSFFINMRVYGPASSIIALDWVPPGVRRVGEGAR